jgi:branched-chain amino acid aminotransferase
MIPGHGDGEERALMTSAAASKAGGQLMDDCRGVTRLDLGERLSVYANGRFLDDAGDARVSLFDRGYLLGDGAFETMRVYRAVAFCAQAHLERLERASQILGIPLPVDKPTVHSIVREGINRSCLSTGYIRVTLTRGPGPNGIGTAGCGPSSLSVIVKPLCPYPATAYTAGIETTLVRTRRVPAACLDPSFKSNNYLPQILAKRELEPRGLLEGVQLAVNGEVVGGTVSNLFLVSSGELQTPWLQSGCLPGITRRTLLEIARREGLVVRERRITPEDLLEADELFFASTLMEVLPVRRLGDRKDFAVPARVTERLSAAFRAFVAKHIEEEQRG